MSSSHIGSPLSHLGGSHAPNHATQHSTPIGSPLSHLGGSHASHHSTTPIPFSVGHAPSPLPFSLSHSSKTSSPIPFGGGGHLSSATPPTAGHAHQLSMGHLGHASLPMQVSHASQLSTPLPLSSPRHAVSDFYEGISSAMSSTARGPLSKLGIGARVRSGSPAHIQRSATPSELLRYSPFRLSRLEATSDYFVRPLVH